jgi:hypothetical protein
MAGVRSKNEDRVCAKGFRMVSAYPLERFPLQRRKKEVAVAIFSEDKIDSSVAQSAYPVEENYGLSDH